MNPVFSVVETSRAVLKYGAHVFAAVAILLSTRYLLQRWEFINHLVGT